MTPLRRRKALRANPETHREWQRRSRDKQIEAQRNGKACKSRIKARRKSKQERDAYVRKYYGSQDRLLRIKATPCAVCGELPSENHHVRSKGAGGTWENVVPLCARHHRAFHDLGYYTFSNRYGIDLAEVAERLAVEVKP